MLVIVVLTVGLACLSIPLISRNRMTSFLMISVLTIGLITTRPGFLGERWGFAGDAVWAMCAFVGGQQVKGRARSAVWAGLTLITAYWIYISLVTATRISAPSMSFLFKCLLADAMAFAAGAALSRWPMGRRCIGFAFLALVGYQAIAYTIGLVLRVGLGRELPFVSFSGSAVGGRDWIYSVRLPGYVTGGSSGAFSWMGPRLVGFGGEPGAYAGILAAVVFLIVFESRRLQIFWVLSCVLGVLYTQSIGGILALICGLAVFVVARLPSAWRALAVVVAGVFLPAFVGFYSRSPLGLSDKRSVNEASVTDRLGAFSSFGDLVQGWITKPFGMDLPESTASGINLLNESIDVGFCALALTFLIFLVVPQLSGRTPATLPVVASLLVTMTMAQPGMANPYWLLCLGLVISGQLRIRSDITLPADNRDHERGRGPTRSRRTTTRSQPSVDAAPADVFVRNTFTYSR